MTAYFLPGSASGTLISSASSPVAPGFVMINSQANTWIQYNATNASNNPGSRMGIAMSFALPGNTVSVQTDGIVPYNIFNLGPGSQSAVIISSAGAISRGTVGATVTVIGSCDPSGSITVSPTYVGQTGGSSVGNGNALSIFGIPVSGTLPTTGQGIIFDGTQYSLFGIRNDFDIRSYGAIATSDGSVDCAPALQLAINASQTANSGMVRIPPAPLGKSWWCNSSVTVGEGFAHVEVRGEGWWCGVNGPLYGSGLFADQTHTGITGSVLRWTGNNGITVANNHAFSIGGVAFVGPGAVSGTHWDYRGPDYVQGGGNVYPQAALRLGAVGGLTVFPAKIENCLFANFTAGLSLYSCEQFNIERTTYSGCFSGLEFVHNGYATQDGVGLGTVLHTVQFGCTQGMSICDTSGVHFRHIESNTCATCILIKPAPPVTPMGGSPGGPSQMANIVFELADLESWTNQGFIIDTTDEPCINISIVRSSVGISNATTNITPQFIGSNLVNQFKLIECSSALIGGITQPTITIPGTVQGFHYEDLQGMVLSNGAGSSTFGWDNSNDTTLTAPTIKTNGGSQLDTNLSLPTGGSVIAPGHVSAGAAAASVAATGAIRLPYGGIVKSLDGNSVNDLNIFTTTNTSDIAIGDTLHVGNVQIGGTGVIAMLAAVGGRPSSNPLSFASTSAITNTSGTVTLSAAQYSTVVIPLAPTGGNLSGDLTLAFPNSSGYWLVDISAMGFNTHNLILTSGSASKTLSSANGTLVQVVSRGSNTIAVLA